MSNVITSPIKSFFNLGDPFQTGSVSAKFPNPFCDIASEYVPNDIKKIFEWCEYLMLAVTPFSAVTQRVISYFLTDVEIEGQSDQERVKYEKFLNDQLHLLTNLGDIGRDYMTYGQSFISIYFPFDRYLICPHCFTSYNVKHIDYKFDSSIGKFKIDCVVCKKKDVIARREDRRSTDETRVRLIRWNPKQISLRVHPLSGHIEYFWEIDEQFISNIISGNPFYLNDTPWSIIEACISSQGSSPKLYKFFDGSVYHLKSGTLAGLPIVGWAIPPLLTNFKLAYYVQLLRRYDEAIALDFIVPFRVIFPAGATPQGQSPLNLISMQTFISQMQQMIEAKRKNITDIQIAPFAIGYQMVGGEARTLAPKESISFAVDELLNAMGFPAELYRGTLQIQAFPVALRLFQKNWGHLVDGFNSLIAWILKRISSRFMWGSVTGRLKSITIADDIERKMIALQAAAGMDISKQTAYRAIGIDYLDEQRRIVEEQQEIQRLQQEAMEQQQAQQMGLAATPGPQNQSSGEPLYGATPGDVYEQSKLIAKKLLFETPETLRRGELIKIKHSNPTLHALVLKHMNEIRDDMSRQGRAMMMQQMKSAEDKTTTFDPFAINLLIVDQLTEYNRDDLRKIAVDIKNNCPGSKDAFHFIYSFLKGKKLSEA